MSGDQSRVAVGRQPVVLEDLTEWQQEIVRLRYAHVQEAETGFRSGDPWRAVPGEPRQGFDPRSTTVAQRRAAKVAELAALGADEAAAIGFTRVSVRTLQRYAVACRRLGMLGCVDGHWLRASAGHLVGDEPVHEAIFAVRAETLHRSRVSMATRHRLVAQYLRERFGTEVAVPSYWTLRRVWLEWFGPGGTRQRYARSGVGELPSGGHVVVHRPGQVVALDTTVLPVKVREQVFGDAVSAHLTLALDVYTHAIVGFRLTLVSDTSVDVAMMLRDVMTPKPLREGWGPELAWAYPGVPAAVVEQLAGYPVAGVPFLTPETITVDHGSVYKNHHLVQAQRVLGVNVLPARVLRPTDKHAVERTFAGIQSLLFELLPGWQGIDVADRGADPTGDATLTLTEMEHLVATWIVKIWQQRVLGEYAPAWDPGGVHSPNSLFAAASGQGGLAVQVPPPELYYPLLPCSHVKIHGRRGVKIRGLWYDGPALDDYRDQVSARGGRHRGRWAVHYDRRDARWVFFQDPNDHGWHRLAWVGMPADGQLPAFGDACREQLLRTVKQAGLTPRSDAELLPVLLDLLAEAAPVDRWATQDSKQARRRQAREATQAAAAQADRPKPAEADAPPAPVVPLRRVERLTQAQDAIDAERRRRREQAVPNRPTPPPRLGDAFRRHSLLRLPDDDEPEPAS
ncbi:MAG: DDE-type integrase/transposase/recombinase [Micromonosporaceae bacterium]|nr:DDE-type integrase/transposase/recombinase [Micromonosporaceae bacterium]